MCSGIWKYNKQSNAFSNYTVQCICFPEQQSLQKYAGEHVTDALDIATWMQYIFLIYT